MLPLLLQPSHCRCLVVGGGPVGRRKATLLLTAGATVRLVCLEPPQALPTTPQPEWIQSAYEVAHLHGMTLVVAAATAAVNRQVAADARQRGLWVNRADDPQDSDFHFPAVHRQGRLLLTVSTGGASPALAQHLRDELAARYDASYAPWLDLLAEFRPLLAAMPAEKRHALLKELSQSHWREQLQQEGVQAVREKWLRLC